MLWIVSLALFKIKGEFHADFITKLIQGLILALSLI